MPHIPQRFLECSIYLYESKRAAEHGERFGGSGFLVNAPSHNGYYKHIYAVTNKHVVRGGCPVIRLNMATDYPDYLELTPSHWIDHPDGDDLSIAPLELPEGTYKYNAMSREDFILPLEIALWPVEGYGLTAGYDTFMVGRFINHEGRLRNTPALRFGNIAMLPHEPIEDPDGHMQEAFLVESRSIGGYSGSPVFVYGPGTKFDPDTGAWNVTEQVGWTRLLGIDCGHMPHYDKIVDRQDRENPKGWRTVSNTGMSIVIPAWRLEQMLNLEELVNQRKEKEERLKEEERQKPKGGFVCDKEEPSGLTQVGFEEALRRSCKSE